MFLFGGCAKEGKPPASIVLTTYLRIKKQDSFEYLKVRQSISDSLVYSTSTLKLVNLYIFFLSENFT